MQHLAIPRAPKGWVAAAAAAALLAALAGGCSSDKAASKPAKRQVTFGVLAPLSGPFRARGQDLVDGAKLAADDLGIGGGVIGLPVALVTADDRCTAAGGRGGAGRLAATAGLAGVVGGICDDAAGAAARTLGKAGLPFVISSANSPAIVSQRTTPTAYLTNGTRYQEGLATLHWFVFSKTQQLAMVTEQTPAAASLAQKIVDYAPPPVIVSKQTVPAGTTELGTIARKAVASGADTVYWAGSGSGAGLLAATLRNAGYKGKFVASSEADSPDFVRFGGKRGTDGAYVISTASPQNLPAAAAWTKRFTQTYGRAPGRDALQAYDGVRALAQAVTQTGKVDRKLNSKQLSYLDDTYTTFLAKGLQFAPDHTPQADNHIVLRVRAGVFRLASTLRSSNG